MKTIQKQIEIMQHFADGGEIEICKDDKWSDITNPEFKAWIEQGNQPLPADE